MKDDNKFKNQNTFSKPIKAALILLLTFLAIITQTGCGNKEVSQTEFALNTVCTITIYDMPQKEADEIIKEAFKHVRKYENILSKTVEGSDVYRINHADGKPVQVSEDTVYVLEQALYMSELSGGKFDVTIGEIVDMWGFTEEKPRVPKDESIREALPHVDYTALDIDGNTVTLKDPESSVDLGGIAKGYIADKITEFIQKRGVKSAIVNLGGNVSTLGGKKDDTPWEIGIERPYSDKTELIGAVEALDDTLVTSGIYERKFEQDGILYHHILDADTGYPVNSDLEAVTIVAKKGNSSFCDGLSTVCLLLGLEKSQELIEDLGQKYPDMGLEAVFIDKNDDIVQTEGVEIKSKK